MIFAIIDMETDGLYDEVTRMHCFCATVYKGTKMLEKIVIKTPEELQRFFTKCEKHSVTIIGHNIIRYDFPVIKKLFGIEYKGRKWDTLAMSFKLYPDQNEHGLEYYGRIFKVPKPVVKDWEKGKIQEYIHRCQKDVVINTLLFAELYRYFRAIYAPESPDKDIDYCTWKMDCAEEQERNPIKADVDRIKKTLKEVTEEYERRVQELSEVMPKVYKYKTVKRPDKLTKKDGDLSVRGEKWLDILAEKGLPKTYTEDLEVLDKVEEPNPGSHKQIKDWLFDLGWEPTMYKTRISKVTGIVKEVPQIQNDDKELCEHISEVLMRDHPELQALEGMFMIKHRIGVFEGMLESLDDQNKITAQVTGFTNTMRFKHKKPVANLPGVHKPYGKDIRGSFIARDENHLFCGSDMSSLEDTTKQHYIYFYDPKYVEEMRVPGFDPHIDIATLAELMTHKEEIRFKKYKKMMEEDELLSEEQLEDYEKLSRKRSDAKAVNFSGTYGAGALKLSKITKKPLEFCEFLHATYWERNKAIKQICKDAIIKIVEEQMWLWNPVAKMWYYLKHKKDIFSTLNQGTGVYCFDTWIKEVRKRSVIIMLQYHDEIGFDFQRNKQEQVKRALNEAIEEVNNKLNLNVPLGISIDIGDNYSEAH